ncbi:hypothetical protein RFI_12107 [Reticulomyxa filosa]|uniref:Uncharacterized protein n=1 Tax=Reticulomyxa filosa TaxID=46433 RepID=X6NFE2_RETFI|nr:hypothetical protein RFI_12107 [Reticulomyxa filosa]|eukprot:ETO25035.1 hypothetical protein RFI_12107 [Reticulomyxa filosa]
MKSDYIVEHSLSPTGEESDWQLRGRLLIDHTSRSGLLSAHEWTDEEIEKFDALYQGNGYYKLRIKSTAENSKFFLFIFDGELVNSILACQLIKGDEQIVLHADSNGRINGFDYFSTNPKCHTTKTKGSNQLPSSLTKSVEVSMSFGDRGESPFAPEYEASPKIKDQPSFFSKYWWAIGLFGFMMFANILGGLAK